jgi:hypothetical protein
MTFTYFAAFASPMVVADRFRLSMKDSGIMMRLVNPAVWRAGPR